NRLEHIPFAAFDVRESIDSSIKLRHTDCSGVLIGRDDPVTLSRLQQRQKAATGAEIERKPSPTTNHEIRHHQSRRSHSSYIVSRHPRRGIEYFLRQIESVEWH